ncbi:intracellular protease, PfpI family protein [Vibrio cholerae]|uniref:type 1 glutamine amidotransferase domain-containing protein n=2 Tax=Vibrio cholerae TaxID=666 RepID=UPI00068CCF81|nr:type 1 glutamine amidotransferase domain-containing protein [Vibrio cholerae]EJE4199119.1 type 1 glutamine amidotransferase [Vibrio cholerae]EKA4522393.1 type 1 glutamine amidotransferase [Vibrio cholerae]ELE5866528.1 type 1 glutamine amidotransferase [Vibrio cholerae]ELG7082518.1 type 1 glutamine amidotransferase [Vibrio cholerae]ELG7084583.1 type 1 glutamine amidotransferase [Vibrio cholerae]
MKKKKLRLTILTFTFSTLLTSSVVYANENKVNFYNLAPTTAYVPTLDTVKLITADGDLNKELKEFMLKTHTNNVLKNKRIAILATDGVEELEILVPLNYLRESGADVTIVSPRRINYPESFGLKIPEYRSTHIMTVRLMENSGWLKIDKFIDEVSANDFDGLVLPGGAWNPDFLRTDINAQNLVKSIVKSNKPLATICHGPLVLINADLVKGKNITGYWAIMKDLENAGAIVKDEPVVIDGNLLSSRFPYDLPRLMNAFTEKLLK